MWSNDADSSEKPLLYWPDAYTQAVAESGPESGLFQEFLSLAMRAQMDRPGPFFVAADVCSVMVERGVHFTDLANALNVPYVYIYAVMRGWHRLGLRGLALVAEALDVPIAAFLVDADGSPRPDLRRYHSYRLVAPRVTILGGA